MKWLFVGNYQSESRGSYTVSEQISDYVVRNGDKSKLVSTSSIKLLRVFQYLFSALFSNADRIHMDIFSGKPFLICYYMACIFKFRKKRVHATLHGGRLLEYLSDSNNLDKLFIYDTLLCPSFKITKYLNDKGIIVKHLPNPVNTSRFPFLPVNKPKIIIKLLWVRAFSKLYNPYLPVELVQLMRNKNMNVELTMIGPDGGLLEETKELISKKNLESYINIVGKVKNEELNFFFNSHHIFLSTSKYESFGMSIIEAALSGITIVAFPTGEIPFIWNESEIFFTNDLNSKSYYDSIEKLLSINNWQLRLKKARAKAEEFKKDKIMIQWTKLIKNGNIN